MSTVKPTRYEYTRLLEVPESGRVNVYGVVRSVTQSSFGGLDIEIEVGTESSVFPSACLGILRYL